MYKYIKSIYYTYLSIVTVLLLFILATLLYLLAWILQKNLLEYINNKKKWLFNDILMIPGAAPLYGVQ